MPDLGAPNLRFRPTAPSLGQTSPQQTLTMVPIFFVACSPLRPRFLRTNLKSCFSPVSISMTAGQTMLSFTRRVGSSTGSRRSAQSDFQLGQLNYLVWGVTPGPGDTAFSESGIVPWISTGIVPPPPSRTGPSASKKYSLSFFKKISTVSIPFCDPLTPSPPGKNDRVQSCARYRVGLGISLQTSDTDLECKQRCCDLLPLGTNQRLGGPGFLSRRHAGLRSRHRQSERGRGRGQTLFALGTSCRGSCFCAEHPDHERASDTCWRYNDDNVHPEI